MAKVAKSSPGGSKPGERRGGRQKGTPNKKTAAVIAAIEQGGQTPLAYMLDVMRAVHPPGADPVTIMTRETQRFEAAKAAAPYVHPKLAAIEHSGPNGSDIPVRMELVLVRP